MKYTKHVFLWIHNMLSLHDLDRDHITYFPAIWLRLTIAMGGVGNAIQARRIADDSFPPVVVLRQLFHFSIGKIIAGLSLIHI